MAPSTVLRLSRFFGADDSRENSRHKQQEPHGRLVYAALITIAPRVPIQRMWTRRGLVHRIGSTRPANATHGGQALFKCFPPAIRGTTAMPKIVIGAPRIVSRL